MSEAPKYTMRLSLQVLEHLGFNLYSNIPAVLSEVVANAWDADADSVTIEIEDDKIVITDDGNGMSLTDINEKYLYVGYKKRNERTTTPKYERPVMGRKGIGKLSLFSIANNIEIHTAKVVQKEGKSPVLEKNGFVLDRSKIIESISGSSAKPGEKEEYHPTPIAESTIDISNGTKLIITQFDKNVNKTENYLRRRLAKRFSIINDKFQVIVNGKGISIEDRDYFNKIQFLWLIGDHVDSYSSKFKNIKSVNKLSGEIASTDTAQHPDFKISGWIGAVEKPADLGDTSDAAKIFSNNKISILSRGKLAQEDVLKSLNESGVFATYLIGEISADVLDDSDKQDIATSSRQSIKEDDVRFQSLLVGLQALIKQIKKVWVPMRNQLKVDQAINILETERPVVLEWFNTLGPDSKEKAKELFATIESFHFDETEAAEKKRELYKQAIVAFEKLRLIDSLSKLDKIQSLNDVELAAVFSSINDIEAHTYYDIAKERVKIIGLFASKLDNNDLEKHLQTYLFDNLWLLNPSWERATAGTERMEERVKTAFDEVATDLTPEEGKGRFDIRYRTAGGKHIIVELKRYEPTYKIDSFKLAKQASKYYSGLKKCLIQNGESNPYIEVIIVLGEPLSEDQEAVEKRLATENARLVHYDKLVEESLLSYGTYLEKNKQIGKLREIIDRI